MVPTMAATSPIADALKSLQVRIAEREEYRRFYRGDHGVHLHSPSLRRALKGHRGFALNFCKVVTDSLADRVQVSAVTASVPDEVDEDAELDRSEAATDAVQAIWERSSLDVTQLAWRYSVDGEAYAGLELDESGAATVKSIDADMVAPLDDGSLFVMTSDETGMLVAPDGLSAIHYSRATGGEWAPDTVTTDDGESAYAMVASSTRDGKPLRIIERIRNGDNGDTWGTSDLDVAIPQQRAINARAIDIHEVAGNASWPQNWIVGPGASKAAGRLYSRAGAIHGVEGEGLTTHQFPAADATKLQATLDGLIEYLSVTSGTPLQSSSTGANSSAESRRIAQDRLTRRVMKALDTIGEAIARLLESALLAEFGIVAKAEVSWESPEPVAEKDALESAMLKLSLGVSRHTLLGELGYDPDREAALRADERAEQQVAMTRAVTTGTDTAADITSLLVGADDAE